MAKKYEHLSQEILKYARAKQAGADSQVPETDPAHKGHVTTSEDPDTSKIQGKNAKGGDLKNPSDGAGAHANTTSSTESAPACVDGNAKDKAYTAPNTPLSKIASKGQRISAGLQALITKKAAEEGSEKCSEEDDSKKDKENPYKSKDDEKDTDAPEEEAAKEAGADILSKIDGETLKKIARVTLETEEGRAFAITALTKKAGQEAAERLLKEAADEASALAYYEQHLAQAEIEDRMAKQAFDEAFNALGAGEQDYVEKAAAVHAVTLETIEHPLLKQAYAQGVMDADAAMGDEMGTIEGAEEAPSLEQIAMILEALVQSGEVSEEDALDALEILASEMGGGAADPEAEAAMAAEAEAAMAASPEKMASASDVTQAILNRASKLRG